jgi:hypothetical protein
MKCRRHVNGVPNGLGEDRCAERLQAKKRAKGLLPTAAYVGAFY